MEKSYIQLNLPNFITIALMAALGGLVISALLRAGRSLMQRTGDDVGMAGDAE